MSNEPEGTKKNCTSCDTPIVYVKILHSWQGKTEERMQWQNQADGKPHFSGQPGNWTCHPPAELVAESLDEHTEADVKEELEVQAPTNTVKVNGPFEEAEIIARWAGEKAYKIVMADVEDYSKLTMQEKSGLGQKEGMYTRLLADIAVELMKHHGIKTNYGKEE